jgi:hypothetical protein
MKIINIIRKNKIDNILGSNTLLEHEKRLLSHLNDAFNKHISELDKYDIKNVNTRTLYLWFIVRVNRDLFESKFDTQQWREVVYSFVEYKHNEIKNNL